MKSIVSFVFTFILASAIAQDTLTQISGPHGGKLNYTQGFKIEMLGSHNIVFTYLYDKNLNPISNKGITGNVMFFYLGNANLNVRLKAYESNGFAAEVPALDYYYCTVNFNIYGKYISTKFNNLSELAEKHKNPKKIK